MGLGAQIGGFAGGLSTGFERGMKLAEAADERKVKQDERAAKQKSDAVLGLLVPPGGEVEGNWSVDKAVTKALEENKPRPNLIQRMGTAVVRGLRPDDAATAAGVAAPQAMPGAGPQAAGPQAAGPGAEASPEVGEIEVRAAGPRQMTDVERAQLMYAAAVQRKDPALIATATQALKLAETGEMEQELVKVSNSPEAMSNYMSRVMGVDGTFTRGKSGKWKFIDDDGVEDDEEYDNLAQFAQENILPFVKKDSSLAFKAATERREERRAERQLDQQIEYQSGMLGVARQNARTSAATAQANIAQTQEQTRGLKMENDLSSSWIDTLGDRSFSSLTDDRLDRLAPQVAASSKNDEYQGAPIMDQDGRVTGYERRSHTQDAINARRARDQAIYDSMPEVRAGWLGFDPATKRILVRGPDGKPVTDQTGRPLAFTDPDQAAYVARRVNRKQPAQGQR